MEEKKVLGFFLLALALIAGIIFLNILSFNELEKTLIHEVAEKQRIQTEHAARRIEAHVQQMKNELVTITKFPLLTIENKTQCQKDILTLKEQFISTLSNILVADKTGDIIGCSNEQYQSLLGLNIKKKDYFQIPKQTKEPYVSSLQKEGNLQQEIIIAAPMFSTEQYTPYPNFLNNFQGIVFSILELQELFTLYIHPILGNQQSHYRLLMLEKDQKQTVLLQSPGFPEIPPELLKMLQEKRTITIMKTPMEGETIITASPIYFDHNAWLLVTATPFSAIDSVIQKVKTRHMIILFIILFFLLGGVVSLVILYKQHLKIRRSLVKATKLLADQGISLEEEKDIAELPFSLEKGKIYLFEDKDQGYKIFASLAKQMPAIGFIREHPELFTQAYGKIPMPLFWLSKKASLPFYQIKQMKTIIKEFTSQHHLGLVFIEDIAYLVEENNEEEVTSFLRWFFDEIKEKKMIGLLLSQQQSLPSAIETCIKQECISFIEETLKERYALTKQEKAILHYILKKNEQQELVSFRDISKAFSITKPTTRTKLHRLQQLGLIIIEKKGRFKTLKVTSLGKRLV